MSFGQQLLNLPLKFLCLLRITPIGWSVRNCHTWHKINLMLYSSNMWQSTRHIIRKHVLIFLQQRDNNTRQRFVKFVSIKTCIFEQECKYRLVCIKSTLNITRLSIKTCLFFCFSLIFSTLIFLFTFFFSLFTPVFPFTLFLIIFFEPSVSQFFFNSFSLFNFI